MRRYCRKKFTCAILILAGVIFILTRKLINRNGVNLNDRELRLKTVHSITPALKKRYQPTVCENLGQPWNVANRHVWQPLANSSNKHPKTAAFIFSAYFEELQESRNMKINIVRLVGVYIPQKTNSRLFCQLWYKSGRELSVVPASIIEIPEGEEYLYKACFFICKLSSTVIPYAVSLVSRKCEVPVNFLAVQQMPATPGKVFTVCVSPLNSHYNNVHQLTEMVEINRMFGADKFIFYNHSVGPKVARVLASLQSQSLVEIIPWNLPMQTGELGTKRRPEIHYFGQLSALNDCLYYARSSRFLVFTDMDELVVPRMNNTWKELIQEVDNKNQAASDIYMFRCVFFRQDWPDTYLEFNGKHIAHKYKLSSLLKLNREPVILNPYRRSKLIVRPKPMMTMGVHNVWSETFSQTVVSPHIGLLHHYRDWQKPSDTNRVTDKTMLRFLGPILRRVTSRWKSMEVPVAG